MEKYPFIYRNILDFPHFSTYVENLQLWNAQSLWKKLRIKLTIC